MNKQKDIQKILEEDGYNVINKSVLPDKPQEQAIPYESERAQDYLNFLQKKSDREKHIAPTAPIEKVPDQKSELASIKSDEFDIPTIVGNLNWHMNRISENVIGRSEIIRQAMFAILTGEHMLLLSRTGMAKSYLAQYIFNTFEGARIFSSQASKDQTPDNYFGPYNIEEFKKGRIRHNIKGSIIEANLVFLDEFFDASDVVLRSLLTVLNERKFINGSEQIDTAVHTAIATANYMRMNEVTEAVLDRFTYKSIIPENTNVYNQLLIDHTYAMSGGKPVEPEQKIFFNQILYLYEIIKNKNRNIRIETPDFIYFMKNVLVDKFMSEMRKSDYNYFLSPRKIAKLGDFLRASALLNNRFQVNTDDLKEMYHLPLHPEQLHLGEGEGQVRGRPVSRHLQPDHGALQGDRRLPADRAPAEHPAGVPGDPAEPRAPGRHPGQKERAAERAGFSQKDIPEQDGSKTNRSLPLSRSRKIFSISLRR